MELVKVIKTEEEEGEEKVNSLNFQPAGADESGDVPRGIGLVIKNLGESIRRGRAEEKKHDPFEGS